MKKIVRVTVAALMAVLFSAPAQAQTLKNYCGTEIPDEQWEQELQRLMQARAAQKTQSAIYTIPVIIHVIHGGQAVGTYPNLPQAQLVSQILALNNDYAGSGYNSGNYPVGAFSNWAIAQNIPSASIDANGAVKIADCEVQFCLATKDTLGNILTEPGIDRVNYVSKGWTNPGSISSYTNFKNYMDGTIKPGSIWNVTRYLNIWVTDVNVASVNLLGYATFPPLSGLSGLGGGNGTSTTDGFWCYAKCFGSISSYTPNVYYSGYDRGRTSTHEIGHWLGLRHIWGDGNCSATDYCVDTPPASSSNFGSPTYPFKTNACAGNSPDGEMFMNFMDYTNDPAKYMFTTDQANRIQTAMANSPYRQLLGTHNLCSVEYVPATAKFNNIIGACTGPLIKIINTSSGFPTMSYTWSSPGATFYPSNSAISPSVSFSSPGVYTITLAADNGTMSVYTKTINVTSPPMFLSASPATVCAGNSTTLTASGVSTYTWEPGTQVNYEIIEIPASGLSTYTCYGTEVNGCTSTGTLAVYSGICTGLQVAGIEPLNFSVYPNPAQEWLYVSNSSRASAEITVEITDALGRQIVSSPLSFGRSAKDQRIHVSQLDHGVYLVKLSNKEGKTQFIKFIKE